MLLFSTIFSFCVIVITLVYSIIKKSFLKNKKSKKRPVDFLEKIVVPEGEEEDEGMIIPAKFPYVPQDQPLVERIIEDKTTLLQMFQYSETKYSHKTLIGYRKLIKEHHSKEGKRDIITYEKSLPYYMKFCEVHDQIKQLAAGMRKISPDVMKKGGKIGLYLDTCHQWIMSLFAGFYLGCHAVTIYANLGKRNLVKIINETELDTLLVDEFNLEIVDKEIFPQCKSLKHCIVVGKTTYVSANVIVYKFDEVVEIGKKIIADEKNIDFAKFFPDQPHAKNKAVVMYTSGTTSDPKGVIMTHESILATVSGFLNVLVLIEEERHLSYLPLAHSFELVMHCAAMFLGKFIGYGNPRTLIAKKGGAMYLGDIACFQPSILFGVPKVWETIRKGMDLQVSQQGKFAQWIFNWTVKKRIKLLKKGKNERVFLENIVFKKVKEMVGNNIRLVVSGSAPLAEETHYFLQAVFGHKVVVLQGYGLTETCISTSAQSTYEWHRVGNAGYPMPSVRVKIVDVPEFEYFVKDGCGEICVKGKPVSPGYYKNEKETKKVYDKRGWFHTGDVAKIQDDGSFSIIDRVKNLVKLPGGEYVSLINMEMIYGLCPFVQPNGICVIADPNEPYLCSIIMIDRKYTKLWAEEHLPQYRGNLERICHSKELKKAILKNFAGIHKNHDLANFELIKDCTCYLDSFSVDSNTATASHKIIRKNVREIFEKDINRMFKRSSFKKIK